MSLTYFFLYFLPSAIVFSAFIYNEMKIGTADQLIGSTVGERVWFLFCALCPVLNIPTAVLVISEFHRRYKEEKLQKKSKEQHD